jgi:Domain of unknown function (DUF6265)
MLLSGSVPIPSQTTDLHSVAWLSGDWQSVTPNGLVEERWTSPAGIMMVGMSHASRSGKTRSFEYLRLELRGSEIYYIASPNAKKVAEFKLVAATADSLVFEGGDDHVQRVSYRRQGPDEITARIDGKMNGEAFNEEIHYVRHPPTDK